MNDAVKDELYVAMMQDPTLQNWEGEWKKALRAWNWARATSRAGRISSGSCRTRARSPEVAPVDRLSRRLTRRSIGGSAAETGCRDWVPEVTAAFEIDLASLAESAELIRICMGALVRSDGPPVEIREVRDVTNPDSFDRIHKQLLADAEGKTTRLVRTKLATLATLAKREGSLSEEEIAEITDTMKYADNDLEAFVSENPSHGEIAADKPGRTRS